jgi:endogenous inhibitor of DNA gyrase (YacG/DUF329 family)
MAPEPEGMIVNGPDPSTARESRGRLGRCPACAGETWTDNPRLPFCSLTCRLIDLGLWLDERYVVPGQSEHDVR